MVADTTGGVSRTVSIVQGWALAVILHSFFFYHEKWKLAIIFIFYEVSLCLSWFNRLEPEEGFL